jgi:hypothetical protein
MKLEIVRDAAVIISSCEADTHAFAELTAHPDFGRAEVLALAPSGLES